MSEISTNFETSSFYKTLVNNEGDGRLYKCEEIKIHSNDSSDFQDNILSTEISGDLLDIWNKLDNNSEKDLFYEILEKYSNVLGEKYAYNFSGKKLLKKLDEKKIDKRLFSGAFNIISDSKCDVRELGASIGNSWGKFKTSAGDYIESSFDDLDELARNIKDANNKDRIKLIIDTTANSTYEGLEPSKKLKFLGLFLPKSFINFINNSASEFIVKGKKIDTDTFIDDIMGYIENFEGVIDFFEIETKKYAKLDVKNLNFEIYT